MKGLTQDVLSPLASLTHSIQSFEHELETKFPKFSAAKSVHDTLRFMSSLTDQNIVVLHSTNELSLGKKGGLKLNCFFKFKPEERIIEEQLEYLPSIGFIHHSVDEGEKIYKTPQLFFRTYCEAINWLKII